MDTTVDQLGANFDIAAVEALRAREYARLDALGQIYLDYTGAGLYAESQVREHAELLTGFVFGNPHSTNPSSLLSTELVERARASVLHFFDASPDDYTVVFTANASSALKLVGESYPFGPNGRFLLTADNHNSVNGIREFARAARTPITYVPLTTHDLRVDASALVDELQTIPDGPALFAYPAQSNLSGVQHPLEWIEDAQRRGWDVLLDAAAFVATNRLDLSRCKPDFISLSFYKMFGYPTGIGGLIVRHSALARLRRPWFAGGTIKIVSVGADGHDLLDGEGAFEDGTVNFLGLPAIEVGLRFLAGVGLDCIHARVDWLTACLLQRLVSLRHTNGAPLVRIYGPLTGDRRGGTIAFNVLDSSGVALDYRVVETRANQSNISLRSGCFCNPGASEAALGLTSAVLSPLFAHGLRPTPEALRRRHAFGAVRASLGIATTPADIAWFVQFLQCFAD
jgi:selenocysteine lyase/cysteine desulfurase